MEKEEIQKLIDELEELKQENEQLRDALSEIEYYSTNALKI
jgi:regulator of replication initiation timing